MAAAPHAQDLRQASESHATAQLAVVALGGTIASKATAGGAVPKLDADELVRSVPGLEAYGPLAAETFRSVPSTELTLADVVALARRIDRLAAEGFTGVVVTHGTDTLEETAFALDFLVRSEIAVVLTGAMRHADLPSADGAANLLAAVAVAASDTVAGTGPVVVMNETVHAARFVEKAHATSLSAFGSGVAGAIGWVTEGRVRVPLRVARRVALNVERTEPLPVVPLYRLAIGDDGSALDRVVAGPLDGLVVEGFGGGHVPPALVPRLGDLAQRAPVVIASRTGAGDVLRSTYGVAGGEVDLARRGLLSAGYLSGIKARVLLSLILLSDRADRAADAFTEAVDVL